MINLGKHVSRKITFVETMIAIECKGKKEQVGKFSDDHKKSIINSFFYVLPLSIQKRC